MGYNNYGRQNNYGNQNGGYQRQNNQQQAPQPRPFDMGQEVERRLNLFLFLTQAAEDKGIKLEEIKDYIGGWVSGLLIAEDNAAKGK